MATDPTPPVELDPLTSSSPPTLNTAEPVPVDVTAIALEQISPSTEPQPPWSELEPAAPAPASPVEAARALHAELPSALDGVLPPVTFTPLEGARTVEEGEQASEDLARSLAAMDVQEAATTEEEWYLKEIAWPPLPPRPSDERDAEGGSGPTIKIICQNKNGPCSLIALCNILILRSLIVVLPHSRTSVSYTYLSSLVADYLVHHLTPTSPLSLSSALSILPSTRYGLTLNPRFGSIDGFRETETTGELALFRLCGVELVHGWVVDPQDEETWSGVVEGCGDYDTAVERVVEGEILGGGTGAGEGEEDMVREVERRSQWTSKEERQVHQAHLIRQFLDATRTQLTYHGLFLLSSHLPSSSLSALFRNSHLSVLYRAPALGSRPTLFTLVTDSTFAGEREVVWESLEDVEGSAGEFWDGGLRRARVRGGDWVGRERDEGAVRERREEEQVARTSMGSRPANDFELARQLQQEEDDAVAEERAHERRRREAAERAPAVLAPGALSVGPEAVGGHRMEVERRTRKEKRKNGCVVM